MTKPYVVFALEAEKPLGGWEDVLRKDGEVLYFATEREAADAGRAYLEFNFQNADKYQVVDIRDGKLVGTGGRKTGRRPQK